MPNPPLYWGTVSTIGDPQKGLDTGPMPLPPRTTPPTLTLNLQSHGKRRTTGAKRRPEIDGSLAR